MSQSQCLLCRCYFDTNQIQSSDALISKFQRFTEFISAEININNFVGNANFRLCGRCQNILETFSQQYETLEHVRKEVNACVQNVCQAMVEDEDDNLGNGEFGVMRESIMEKAIAFLEIVSQHSESDDMVPPSSTSTAQGEGPTCSVTPTPTPNARQASRRRGRRRKLPLPNYVTRVGRVVKRNRRMPLYHCSICKKDFPSINMTVHRQHQVQEEIASEPEPEVAVMIPQQHSHHHGNSVSPEELRAMEIEDTNSDDDDDADDDHDDMEAYRIALEGLEQRNGSGGASTSEQMNCIEGASGNVKEEVPDQNELPEEEEEMDDPVFDVTVTISVTNLT